MIMTDKVPDVVQAPEADTLATWRVPVAGDTVIAPVPGVRVAVCALAEKMMRPP
jgi:hypothetical protein